MTGSPYDHPSAYGLAVVLEPWVEWQCSCGAHGCHPVWSPTTKRLWHGKRAGHRVDEPRRFEQYVMGGVDGAG